MAETIVVSFCDSAEIVIPARKGLPYYDRA
jgi:hypothetical protein